MSDQIYYVEKILGHRFDSKLGKKVFLIKWMGYPNSQNSWEPIDNIHSHLIQAYESTCSSENDASVANIAHPAKKPKLKRGTRKKIGGGKRADMTNFRNPDDNTDNETDSSNIEPSTSNEDNLATIVETPTSEIKPPEPEEEKKEPPAAKLPRVKIVGHSNVDFRDEKIHMVLEYPNNVTRLVALSEVRKTYPQELIDFYESNMNWEDLCRDFINYDLYK